MVGPRLTLVYQAYRVIDRGYSWPVIKTSKNFLEQCCEYEYTEQHDERDGKIVAMHYQIERSQNSVLCSSFEHTQ